MLHCATSTRTSEAEERAGAIPEAKASPKPQQRRRNKTQLLALKRIVPTYYTRKGPLGI